MAYACYLSGLVFWSIATGSIVLGPKFLGFSYIVAWASVISYILIVFYQNHVYNKLQNQILL
jgi:hypothetical protein